MSDGGKIFKRKMRTLLKKEKIEITDKKVKVYLEFHYKHNYKRDIDSGVKITLDCLQGVVIEDDYQIDELMVRRYEGAEEDKVIIMVKEI
jgi:Holliday junction resolvase RusA-like endonuclease